MGKLEMLGGSSGDFKIALRCSLRVCVLDSDQNEGGISPLSWIEQMGLEPDFWPVSRHQGAGVVRITSTWLGLVGGYLLLWVHWFRL